MKARIITGLILGGAVILLLTLAPAWGTYLLFQVGVIIVADEFYRMTLGREGTRARLAGVAACALLIASAWWWPAYALHTVVGLMPPLLCVVLFSDAKVEDMGPRAGMLLGGVLYVGVAMMALTLLAGYVRPRGPLLILALFATVFAGDTGAYFSGKFLGKSKLYEKISPKKTWAGAVGGAIASVGGFFLVNALAKLGVPTGHAIALGLGCAVSGQIGDLAESLFKRAFGVKDSGTLLPGHGGLLDRIDGVVFAAPYMWIYLELLG